MGVSKGNNVKLFSFSLLCLFVAVPATSNAMWGDVVNGFISGIFVGQVKSCKSDNDCKAGFVCRNKSGGGNECKKSEEPNTHYTMQFPELECRRDSDCQAGFSCRSKVGGGNECRRMEGTTTIKPRLNQSELACRGDSECPSGFLCRSKVGGGAECREVDITIGKEIPPIGETKVESNNDSDTPRLREAKRQREKQRHSQKVSLYVSNSQPSNDGSFNITIQTNTDTASLKINGEEQGGRSDGNYSLKRVARVGQDTQFTITAVDIYGNSDTKTITVTRQAAPAADTSIALKPEAIKRAPVRDAVAIIIGIQDYKRVPKAEFANNDAREFYEYAIRALGIKQEKIKLLLDDEADEVNIVKAFENWLPIQVNKDKTDVYVFYSGHGLPAPDGKSLYFLPHGVDKELLSRTAVGQNEIVAALSAAKPKSVTMFIDACYSEQTRGGDVLVANAKPLSLKSDTNAYPPNFTVITASANDQISSSSPELKHGIFSFYLMKGMEGEADANKDGKITVGEMQDYLSDKVSRQAMTLNRKQTTQLVGDPEKILLRR